SLQKRASRPRGETAPTLQAGSRSAADQVDTEGGQNPETGPPEDDRDRLPQDHGVLRGAEGNHGRRGDLAGQDALAEQAHARDAVLVESGTKLLTLGRGLTLGSSRDLAAQRVCAED